MKKNIFFVSAILCLASNLALGFDFSAADKLFAKRGHGATDNEKFKSATAARAAYERALRSSNLSQEDKIYAVAQIGRLDLYRAGALESVNKTLRQEALESCLEIVEKIAHTDRQEYHCNKIACIALRGKISNGVLDRAKYGLKLKLAQNPAIKATQVDGRFVGGYDAGGILRFMSAVRGNRKAKPLGLYDPKEALEFAKAALASPKSKYRPFTHEYSGKDYYENYYYYGQAMIAMGLENQNIQTVKEGANLLVKIGAQIKTRESVLPVERKPERDYYLKLMFRLNNKVQNCIKQNAWVSCLQKELDKEEN